MNNIDRAKQFLAFEALKGLDDALKEKEKIFVEKKIISKDDLDNLSYKISQLKKGMMIELIYYENHEYLKIAGIITKLDYIYKTIMIMDKKIYFADIISIQGDNISDLYDY